jgi:hypothetical protein
MLPLVTYLVANSEQIKESHLDIDPVLEHTGGGGAPVLAEFLTAVGALEGFVVSVKRAVGILEVFLAAEGWNIERETQSSRKMRLNTRNENCGAG